MPDFTTKFGIRKPLGQENVDEAELGLAFDRIDSVTPKVVLRKRVSGSSPAVGTGGEITLAGTTGSFTVPINRLIECTITAHVFRTVADGTSGIRLRRNPGGTLHHLVQCQPRISGQGAEQSSVFLIDNLPAGTHEFYLTLAQLTGTGTTALDAASEKPLHFIMKDIGPVAYE